MKLKTTILAIIVYAVTHYYKPIIALATTVTLTYEIKAQNKRLFFSSPACATNGDTIWYFTTFTSAVPPNCSPNTIAMWGTGRRSMFSDFDSTMFMKDIWMTKLNSSFSQTMGQAVTMIDNNGKLMRVPMDTIAKYFSLPFSQITGFNSSSVTAALGFTPYSNANPNGYISSYTETDPIWTAASGNYLTTANAAATYQPIGTYATASNSMTFTNKSGNISQWTNNSGYITGISSGDVTAALGFTPYNSTNPSGYITASSSSALTNKTGNISQWTNDAGYLTSLSGAVLTSRTISTTSPLTGGGDLSANRTFAINNAAADNATKGASSFDSSYFDAASGNISYVVNYGTGTVSSGAVTINAPRGKITVSSPNISLNSTLSVTFTNSYINSTSTINVGINGAGSNLTIGVNLYVKS